ncbi:MAG: HAMP domain-containing histidine kinase [Nitrospinota bacterium]|nr:HAMP domain-containing histidine kinase [Nitrospinota bacterium]
MAEGSPISEIQEDGAGGDLVVSGAPIKGLERDMLGAVILASSASVAQSMQEKAMENAIEASMFTFIVITFGLALFATRLALRIHRLRREAEGAIDATGRVTVESLEASRDAGDEIGDLSRSISQLLTRLRRHQNFLALLPGALKHEINNPLNNITVSLENLEAHTPAGDAHKYIKSAGRGAARLKELVDSLAEAASVEDSIHKEKFERVCLSSLLERYMENSARMDARHIIKFANLAGDAYIEGSDFRIEQMLDKLMDNAMDYCPDGGMIEARLERSRNGLLLNFSNSGPPIPDHMKEKIFDSLVSTREGRGGARPHLGIGLYIARVIAEGHGGSISASKLPENKGTIFQMIFPENRLR